MSIRRVLLNSTVLAGILATAYPRSAAAADIELAKPSYKAPVLAGVAVDGVNAKWEVLGGSIVNRALYGSRAALSIPLAAQWGLQIDGAFGSLDGRAFGSIAPHLFWRDPSRGLVGLFASHTRWDQFGGVYVTQVAGEGEAYLGRFTIQGIAGVELGNNAGTSATTITILPAAGAPGLINTSTLTQSYDIKTRFFDQINLKYYFGDDWAGYIGHRYVGGKNAIAVGAEAAVGLGRGVMASAFVEGRAGESQSHGVFGGLRLYFGQKDKSLIRRHREDDPPIWDTLHSLVNNYKQTNSASSTPFCNPPQELQPNGTCEAPFGGG